MQLIRTEAAISLQKILQKIHRNYAYEVLALEVSIACAGKSPQNLIADQIAKLTQLYMVKVEQIMQLAVEAFQNQSDQRYEYFNLKIQSLMKNRSIVEEFYKNKEKHAVGKANIKDRKFNHEMQVCFISEQYNPTKIKQIVKNAQNKLQTIQRKIQSDLKQQSDRLQERIKERKRKSDTNDSISHPNSENTCNQSTSKKIANYQEYFSDQQGSRLGNASQKHLKAFKTSYLY